MDFQRFLETWRGTQKENRFHRVVNGLLAVVLVLMAYGLINRPQVVTLVPVTLTEEAWITRDAAQESYKNAWGLFLAQLLGNVTPGNVKIIEQAIEPLLDPAIYDLVMRSLRGQADAIVENRVTMRYEPRKVMYERATDKVFVEGYAYTKASGGEEKRRRQSYEFVIAIEGYAPMIKHIETYSGEARTQKVLERLRRQKNHKEGKR